ncbi:MAG: DNA-binding protein WhiA [Lachnospiraceae bacterium]|nr:DNA-binding protein WhiA [Lachnospiraceae bacterium]
MSDRASFSLQVKEELSHVTERSRESSLAELHALMLHTGRILRGAGGKRYISARSDSLFAARKCFTLLRKSFNIYIDICVRKRPNQREYFLLVRDPGAADEILRETGLRAGNDGRLYPASDRAPGGKKGRRAFLRGLFTAAGSINSPDRSYHFQIAPGNTVTLKQALSAMESFGIDGKIKGEGGKGLVYLKDGSLISDMLNVMGAHGALLRFENERVLKDVRNAVNRQVNCETANIKKTVRAFEKLKEDILFLKKTKEFDRLPEKLREVAELRLDNPEASLEALGEMLKPQVGKSGINHRLRRLSEAAEDKRRELQRGKQQL